MGTDSVEHRVVARDLAEVLPAVEIGLFPQAISQLGPTAKPAFRYLQFVVGNGSRSLIDPSNTCKMEGGEWVPQAISQN
jgi:hypothetical protein